MSRRHKENDIEQTKPHQAESQRDDSMGKIMRFTVSSTSLKNKMSRLCHIISNAVTDALKNEDIEIDDQWVKIPRRYLELKDFLSFGLRSLDGPPELTPHTEKKQSKRGRHWLKRLVDKVEDSTVVGWFKTTLNKAKEMVQELYQNVTQFAVCFLKGIHEAFCPDDDPYGKLSHYHRMLVNPDAGIPDIPSRETLSRYYRWFRDWREEVTFEDRKAKRMKRKHRIWERLIQWIKEFLLAMAPQYAAQPVYEVGI